MTLAVASTPTRAVHASSTGSRRHRARAMTRATPIAPFEFQTATRMVFGRDAFARVPSLVAELATLEGVDATKNPIFVVTGASDRFSAPLEAMFRREIPGVEVVTFHCPKGEPTTASAEEAIRAAVNARCGVVVAVGGGTAVDTAKCVAAMLTNGGESPDLYDFLEVVGRAQPPPPPTSRRRRSPRPKTGVSPLGWRSSRMTSKKKYRLATLCATSATPQRAGSSRAPRSAPGL